MDKRNENVNKGLLSFYLKWPLYIAILLVIAWVLVLRADVKCALILLPFILIILIYSFYLKFSVYSTLLHNLLIFINNNTEKQKYFLQNINIPYAVCDEKGNIIYSSKYFSMISKEAKSGCYIGNIFSEINKTFLLNADDTAVEVVSSYQNKKYNIHIMNMDIKEILDFISSEENKEINVKKIYLLLVEDCTIVYDLKQQNDDMKSVVGCINIDNYEEVLEDMESSKAAMLVAMVDRKITRYISNNGGILKKLEKDKYFFVSTKNHIDEMIRDKFSILDAVREVMSENNIPLTLSIGIGYEGKSLETNHDYANASLDMALGRGGDQVVVKKGQDVSFFGGKSASTNKNKRVVARVKSVSFREIINTREKIFILGHRNADMDCFGASLGVYVMANFLGKEVHIVENSVTKDVEEMKEILLTKKEFENKVFVTGDEAIKLFDEHSALVVVDLNNPSIADEPRLLEMSNFTILFDHHRLAPNSIQNAIMSYVEPSASSSCELLSEVIQYFDDKIKIPPYIADCMLCGIVVDTNNYTFMVGSKTFDAASYLRTSGADINRVRKMMRVPLESEKLRHDIEDSAEFYKNEYAIVALEDIEGEDMPVLASKVANDLINIDGIKASVVITHTEENNMSRISARSIDEVNVQVLMEKLGGGGHRGAAGASLEDTSLEQAMLLIKETIDKMIEEKEIE